MPQTTWTRGTVALLTLLPLAGANAALPVPHCRASDKTESGLQGFTTPAEISSGASAKGFNCNADVVGQYQGEGASWQLTAWKNCAYFDQRLNSLETNPGTVVLDVTDPAHPTPTKWLNDNAMLDPWESLKVNPARQLLAGDQKSGTGFVIYDISADCKNPVQKSFINIPGMLGHTGQWAPDGKTYYVTPLRADQSMIAIDTADVTAPKLIPCGAGTYGCASNGFFVAPADIPVGAFHDVEFSKDGNTAYVTMFGVGGTAGKNGLVILDVSDFQQRKANPSFRKVSTLTWDDGSVGAQNALPITIAGKPYLLFSDEAGGGTTACSQGKSGSGLPRLIDISDVNNPKTVAKLSLDIQDPANCTTAVTAPVTSATGSGFFAFSCHYCNVDDVDNATVAACNCFAAGLRIFSIADVNNPREIAYYKPPAQGTKALPGSQYANSVATTFTRNFDWATSKPSFPKDRGASSGDLWTTSQDNGFMVVKIDQNAFAGAGGGCASADASVGGLLVFGLAQLWRRRRRSSSPK